MWCLWLAHQKRIPRTYPVWLCKSDDKAQFYTLRTAKALAMTALDVLLRPELLLRVKQEITEATLKEDRTLMGEHTEQSLKHC
uniref:peptidase M20 domain-containing protein 2-like n=1 Tax=Epinephelus lanceolatus TaxID=310571 RepID=UPI001447F710|nr:peptidase M20 domain-containing protein 2-like [Epinephelus lanceolatus]